MHYRIRPLVISHNFVRGHWFGNVTDIQVGSFEYIH